MKYEPGSYQTILSFVQGFVVVLEAMGHVVGVENSHLQYIKCYVKYPLEHLYLCCPFEPTGAHHLDIGP